MTAKYARLEDHLKAQKAAQVPMRFEEIERLIGAPLPTSARKHRPWWSNNPSNSVITHAWLRAGFKTESVDMAGETLVFRRGDGGPRPPATQNGATSTPPFDESDPLAGLYGALKGTGHVPEGVDLTKPLWDSDWEEALERKWDRL